MKRILNFSLGLLAVCMLAFAITAPLGASSTPFDLGTGATIATFVGVASIVVIASLVNSTSDVLNVGLNKEVWLPDLLEAFYADTGLMAEFVDLSPFVENDKINLAEAGIDPIVFVNSAGPISYTQRTDVPISLELDTLDTENSLIKNIEIAELSYDKRKSLLAGHANSLRMWFFHRALFNIAPATDTTFTPKLTTTGADDGTGRKRLKFADIRKMKRRFDQAQIPQEGRVIALSSTHEEDLDLEDLTLYTKMMDRGTIYGFKIYIVADLDLPRYNKTTGAKVAWNAAAAPSTDAYATVVWHNREVMKCLGTADMFLREKDPELRGDMFGFQQRALSSPLRNKAIGAIYSVAA